MLTCAFPKEMGMPTSILVTEMGILALLQGMRMPTSTLSKMIRMCPSTIFWELGMLTFTLSEDLWCDRKLCHIMHVLQASRIYYILLYSVWYKQCCDGHLNLLSKDEMPAPTPSMKAHLYHLLKRLGCPPVSS